MTAEETLNLVAKQWCTLINKKIHDCRFLLP